MDLRAITDLEGGRLQSGKLFGPVGPADFPPISSWRVDPANPLAIGCGSTSLCSSRRRWHTEPFTCASLNPPSLPSTLSPRLMPYVQQRNAYQNIKSTDSGGPNVPWDPGVSVNRRQIPPHVPTAPAPPPPSTPGDGSHLTLTRHKDRGDSMYRVSKGKRSDAAGHGIVSSDHVRNTNNEDKSDPPFVPHHASRDPLVHHPSSTQLTRLSDVPATSRATHIVSHPVR